MDGGPWDPDEQRECTVCLEDMPASTPADVAVCFTCENAAREDRGEEPLAEPPW